MTLSALFYLKNDKRLVLHIDSQCFNKACILIFYQKNIEN